MRKYYLDNIRWITVVLVVIYHVIFMFNGIITELVVGPFHPMQYQDAIQYLLYPWFMIILFVVAGASSKYALEIQSTKKFFLSRTRKLLVPSTIGLFVFHWITGYVNMRVTNSDAMPQEIPGVVKYVIWSISGTGVLWFIQMLWIFSLLLLLVRKLNTPKVQKHFEKYNLFGLLLLGIPLWLFGQILNTPVIIVYRFGIYGFAFFLGYFVFSHEEVIEKLSRYWLFLSISALGMGGVYVYCYYGENYAADPILNNPFSIAYGWIAILAVFALAKKFGDRTSAFTVWMGKHSFGLYVFHYTIVSMVALWICKGYHLPAALSYILTGVIGFLGSYLLDEFISRIPVVRWCVLGIRKKTKHSFKIIQKNH